jgi:hypothetical protein
MKRWEYRQVIGTPEAYETGPSFEAALNELGTDGWDLVFFEVISSTSPITFVAVLKRERSFAQAEYDPGHERSSG